MIVHMKLILAQGNPGTDYANTRHNVGFLAMDAYAVKHRLSFQHKSKFHADIAEIAGPEKILLAKPTTYYNDTGISARSLADFYKIAPHNILILHDELALPFGTLRLREKGSDAGNNGVKSLNAHLGEQFTRLRIGILSPASSQPKDFVLSKFTPDETAKLQKTIFPKISEIIDDFIADRHSATSYKLSF